MCSHFNRLIEVILMDTQNIPFSIYKKRNQAKLPKSAAMGFFQGTYERVRNSRCNRAISVRAIGVLLYMAKRKGLSQNTQITG